MKQTENHDRRMANHEGGISWHVDLTITVDFLAGGKAQVAAIGTRSEHNEYPTYSTDDETKWATTWTGTWTAGEDARDVELTAASDSCSHKKKVSDQPPEAVACDVPAKTVHVTCKTESVTVENATGTAKPVTVAAWSCDGSAELAETPRTWMLGKSMCLVRTIQVAGLAHTVHYSKCP
jgi:hypothetical protein